MTSRTIISIITAGIIGIAIGRGFSRVPAENVLNSITCTDKLEALKKHDEGLKGRFQEISDMDLNDYFRLRTLEEKYKKADEILSKMILIFLADLGIKISGDKEAHARGVFGNVVLRRVR